MNMCEVNTHFFLVLLSSLCVKMYFIKQRENSLKPYRYCLNVITDIYFYSYSTFLRIYRKLLYYIQQKTYERENLRFYMSINVFPLYLYLELSNKIIKRAKLFKTYFACKNSPKA